MLKGGGGHTQYFSVVFTGELEVLSILNRGGWGAKRFHPLCSNSSHSLTVFQSPGGHTVQLKHRTEGFVDGMILTRHNAMTLAAVMKVVPAISLVVRHSSVIVMVH